MRPFSRPASGVRIARASPSGEVAGTHAGSAGSAKRKPPLATATRTHTTAPPPRATATRTRTMGARPSHTARMMEVASHAIVRMCVMCHTIWHRDATRRAPGREAGGDGAARRGTCDAA